MVLPPLILLPNLTNLICDYAVGIDGISGALLKGSKRALITPITFICNFSTGLFPDAFKLAQVIPIYKKGDREYVDSYRPISILPTLSKILERLLNLRLISNLEKLNLYVIHNSTMVFLLLMLYIN